MEVLLNKARKGDVSSFEELIKEHTKLVYNYCYRMTNSSEDAEDLLAFEERADEALISYEAMVKRLKKDGRI